MNEEDRPPASPAEDAQEPPAQGPGDDPAGQQADQQDEAQAPAEPPAPDPNAIVKKSNPGASRERRASRQDARQSFNRAETVIARDQHVTNIYGTAGPEEGVRIPTVSGDMFDEIQYAFVDPLDFATVLRETEGRRLVIVQGTRGQGRYAVARRLLRGASGLYGLHPEIPLTELTAADLTKGGGYVRRDLTRAEARALTEFKIGSLIELLEQNDCRMVITVGPAITFTESAVAELVVKPGKVQNRVAILERRLAWRLGQDLADAILDDPEIEALISKELADDGPPAHARTVSTELIKAHEDDMPLVRTVQGALKQSGDERLKQWFKGLKTLSVQSMALAVSVLGGEPYETVAAAAELLRRRLAPPDNSQTTLEDLDKPLIDTKDEWLEALGARTFQALVRTRHGAEAPTELVEFIGASAQENVLLYFFSTFDRSRPALLQWLRQCGGHDMEGVRSRTAVATGVLTAKSYDLVRSSVILPWAQAADHRLRDAAAEALAVTANENGMRDAVRKTVEGWAEEESDRLRATAARSWQVEYEAAGPAAALEMLDGLSEDASLLVTDAICTSITDLWEERREELKAPALLLKWVTSRDEQQQLTGLLAFLVAAVELVEELPGDRGTAQWPGLLWFATGDPGLEREIGLLWRHVLAAPGVTDMAKAVLSDWVKTAEPERAVRDALNRLLLVAAAADRTTAIRIRNESVKWAEDAPEFAREIQENLARKA